MVLKRTRPYKGKNLGSPDPFPHFQAALEAQCLEEPCVSLLCRLSPHQSLTSHGSWCCSLTTWPCWFRFRLPHGVGEQRPRLIDSAGDALEGMWDHNTAPPSDHLTTCPQACQPHCLPICSPQSVSRPRGYCPCLFPDQTHLQG